MVISQFMMYLLESKEVTLKWIHTIIDCHVEGRNNHPNKLPMLGMVISPLIGILIMGI